MFRHVRRQDLRHATTRRVTTEYLYSITWAQYTLSVFTGRIGKTLSCNKLLHDAGAIFLTFRYVYTRALIATSYGGAVAQRV